MPEGEASGIVRTQVAGLRAAGESAAMAAAIERWRESRDRNAGAAARAAGPCIRGMRWRRRCWAYSEDANGRGKSLSRSLFWLHSRRLIGWLYVEGVLIPPDFGHTDIYYFKNAVRCPVSLTARS